MDRFRTMPVWAPSVLVGHVGARVARNVVSTALVVLVALAVGFRPDAGVTGWFAAAGLLLLFVLAVTWLSVAIGLAARSVDAANAFSFLVLFVPYLSSAFVPTATMPGWLAAVAEHQPVTPVIETLCGLLLGGPVAATAWVAVLWFAAIGAASFLAAVLAFRRRTGG